MLHFWIQTSNSAPPKSAARGRIGFDRSDLPKGIGIITDRDGPDLVASNAILAFSGVTGEAPNITLPYVFAFLRTDFFVEQVWSLLHRGVYPRMDTSALGRILVPIAADAHVCRYVATLSEAIWEKELAIRDRYRTGLSIIHAELNTGPTTQFRYSYPSPSEMLRADRMDAGFWSPKLQEALYRLANYERGAWKSIYEAGFTTRRGPNLAVSVSGPAQYSDTPFGAALPLATPGDISDFMTLPKFRYYGNRRRVDTVQHGEMIFAAKGVREVSIGHAWVNLGAKPFVTNFDFFLIRSADPVRTCFLAFFFCYLKSAGVFAKLADTSNGGSLVQSHFRALPIPKFEDDFIQQVAKLYHSPASEDVKPIGLKSFLNYHRKRNAKLGIWDLAEEIRSLQAELSSALRTIIEGRSTNVSLPD